MNKQKFQIGDKVVVKNMGISGVVTSIGRSMKKKRCVYFVKINRSESNNYPEIARFLSYQLEKASTAEMKAPIEAIKKEKPVQPKYRVGQKVQVEVLSGVGKMKQYPGKITRVDVPKWGKAKYYYEVTLDVDSNLCCKFYRFEDEIKPIEENDKRTISLTLEKAKEWYKAGGELKEVALQAFTEQELNSSKELGPLPCTWEDFCYNYPIGEYERAIGAHGDAIVPYEYRRNNKQRLVSASFSVLPNDKYVEAFVALMKLISLRQAWIGSWKPDFNSCINEKWCVEVELDKVRVVQSPFRQYALSFPTLEMAKEFIKYFKNLIELAKPLI